ncbi:MAG: DUF6057 family protein [Tannerellaceae bacterium]|nr:DUF6057 family protein [Tannerellaceae bacterium]
MNKHCYKSLFLWLAFYGVLFAFLQAYSEFHFYIVEQNQLFQNTWAYVSGLLMQPGGAALTASEFLMQFFLLPYAGAGITAGLLTVAGWLAQCIVRRIAPGASLMVACLLPALTLMFIHFDFNYLVCGTVAFIMAEAAFYLVMGIKGYGGRFAAHAVMIPLLFCLAGPVSTLYAAMILAAPVGADRRKVLAEKLTLASVAILTGVLSVYFAFCGEYRYAFLPDGYYHFKLTPGSVIYFSWCSLLLLILLAGLLRKRMTAGGKKWRWVQMAAQAALIAVIFKMGVSEYGDSKSYLMKKLDYYSRTGQWNSILEHCTGKLTNYLYLNYANLALLEKGELGDRMFAFDQRNAQGLLVDWNKAASVSVLLSDIYFAVGATAMSQEMAFEACVSVTGDGNPRMLKRLVQTNLIFGAYEVAGKYISILENTFSYSGWAGEQRRFLYNDAEVEADPLLGAKRRSLAHGASLSMIDGMEAELLTIASANPSDMSAITYAGAIHLLEKNMTGFEALIEKHFGTPVLPVLPPAFQEAVIILYEKEPEYWQRYGISPDVAARFAQYKRRILEENHAGRSASLPSMMQSAWGNTYWFYYMFK